MSHTRVALAVLVLSVPSLHAQDALRPSTQTPAGASSDVIDPARRKEVDDTLRRGLDDVRMVNRNLVERYEGAMAAVAVRLAGQLRLAEPEGSIDPARIREAIEAARRVVSEFNANGSDAFFTMADRAALRAYLRAELLARVEASTRSPLVKGISDERLQEVADVCRKYLAAFNQKGKEACCSIDEDRYVKPFEVAKQASEGQIALATPSVARVLGERRAGEAADMVRQILDDYNRRGQNAFVSTSDRGRLESLLIVVSATTLLEAARPLALGSGTEKAQAMAAVAAGEAVLRSFQSLGWEAVLPNSREQLDDMLKELTGKR